MMTSSHVVWKKKNKTAECSQRASVDSDNASAIVTPSKKTAAVWKLFGFWKNEKGKKAMSCKLCEKAVVHAGGTTNLKNHLFIWHRPEYNELYNQTELKTQPWLTDFTRTVAATHTEKFAATSEHVKMLMQAVAEFIAKDLCPIAVVDGVGFLNLIHLAEPRYVVSCRAGLLYNNSVWHSRVSVEDLDKLCIPSAGHTLNLSVQAALKVSQLSTVLAWCCQIVGHFNKSRTDREELTGKQALLELPQYNLLQEVSNQWNSIHDMILRLCEQQPEIAAVVHRRRDLIHLECSPSEWRILEDVAELLQPFKVATEYLSGENSSRVSSCRDLGEGWIH